MAFVMAAGFAGLTTLGIPSGRVATLLGPRRTMLVADLVCAPLIGLIPLLYWLGALSFPIILLVAFAVGGFFPAYTSSQSLLLARLVEEDEARMIRAGGLLGSFNEAASFVGPALGGVLVALLGPAPVLLIDAVSYLASFTLVFTFVADTTAAPDRTARVRAGLAYIIANRALAQTVAGLAVVELAFTAMIGTLPVLARDHYHATARLAGWLLGSYGAGSVLGGLLSARARSANTSTSRAAIVGIALSTWPLLAVLPSYGVALAIAANGVCSGLYFPRFFAALTLRTPAALRATVSASVNSAVSATGPIGFVSAGLILQHASVHASFFLVAVAATLGASVVVAAPPR
jgi:MFS family permease